MALPSNTLLSFSIRNIFLSPDKHGRTAADWCPPRSGLRQQTDTSTTATPQPFVCLWTAPTAGGGSGRGGDEFTSQIHPDSSRSRFEKIETIAMCTCSNLQSKHAHLKVIKLVVLRKYTKHFCAVPPTSLLQYVTAKLSPVIPAYELTLDTYFWTFSCSDSVKLKQACTEIGGGGVSKHTSIPTLTRLHAAALGAPQELLISKPNKPPPAKKQVRSSTFHVNTVLRVFTYSGPFRDTGFR